MDNRPKDKLDVMIQLAGHVLIEQNLQTNLVDELPDVPFPKALHRKIMRMIRHEGHKPEYNDFIAQAKRAVAVFLVACSLCLALAMSVEAVRNAFWNAIVEWFDEYIAVIFEVEEEPLTVIEEYREPRLVPTGCERFILYNNEYLNAINYYMENILIFSYYQTLISDKNVYNYDNIEIDSINEIKINNTTGNLITYKNGNMVLVWNDTKYNYELFTYSNDFQLDLLLLIATSIF